MLDIMLDLETMGVGPCAAIVAIGAIEFSLEQGAVGRKFYRTVDLESSVTPGGEMDASTVMWWLEQSPEARATLAKNPVRLVNALHAFTEWVLDRNNPEDVRVWGNGADFDNAILTSAYKGAMLPRPWSRWNSRCYRTAVALLPETPMERVGTHHNAVDDAESQALRLIKAYRAGRSHA